jgi:hypothetical protein
LPPGSPLSSTTPTRPAATRAPYIAAAREAGFRVLGYYFESRIADATRRNHARDPDAQVPERGVRGTHARLELPRRDEGFDELHFVRLVAAGFEVQPWRDDD